VAEFVLSAADGSAVVRVVGEVDLTNSTEFIAVGRQALSEGDAVELDLSGLTFVDSTGLAVLVQLRKEAVERDAALVLSNLSARTYRVLRAAGLLGYFDIEESDFE
jgi:anti-sigma B factor antagonist